MNSKHLEVAGEKNLCMYCGKESKNRMKFRVVDKKDIFRDFCSTEHLAEYYKMVLKQEIKKRIPAKRWKI